MTPEVLAYLGFTADGAYQLCVSHSPLNPVGTRLERGPHHLLPENVSLQAQNPNDPKQAIAGLISLRNFLAGEERDQEPPEFGDELPKRRRKK